jgi:hypothetical protein
MPMVYVSERTLELIERVFEYLRKNTSAPSRVVKADVIYVAVDEYAKKLGLKER